MSAPDDSRGQRTRRGLRPAAGDGDCRAKALQLAGKAFADAAEADDEDAAAGKAGWHGAEREGDGGLGGEGGVLNGEGFVAHVVILYVTGEQILRQDAAEDARAGRQAGADSVQREVARRFDVGSVAGAGTGRSTASACASASWRLAWVSGRSGTW